MPSRPRKHTARAPRSLRQRATALLMRQEQDTTDLSAHELQRLVHELRLHQIELDLQNEELRRAQADLEAARNRYADLYEFAPVGYFSLDADGIIVEVNLTGSELLGMPRSRLRRRRFSDFVAPDVDTQDAFYHHRQQACSEATSCTCNLWMQRQDGTPFYAQLKSLVRRDGEHTPLRWHLALIDLTALREQAEAQLAWTAAIVESSRDAVIGATQEGHIVSWNTGAQHLYGYAVADVLGQPLVILAPPECREETQRLLSAMQRGERVELHETLHQTQDGRRIVVSLTLSPIHKRDGSIIGVSMICRNITARKQREAQLRATEQALRQSQTQLRRLVWRQQHQQEQERKRMAQEIHDELTQSLTLLHIDLAWLMEQPGITPEVQERLQAIVTQVNDLDQVMHRIAMELRPPLLDDLGLLATLEWQLEEMHRRAGLTYTLQLPSAFIALDTNRSTVVFRIFQEALVNVIRHAKASHVDVRVIQDGEVVVLVVRDNGKGVTVRQQAHRNALGLLGMRERAELWGGEVRVTGQAGRGTTVTVRMPYGSPIVPVDEP